MQREIVFLFNLLQDVNIHRGLVRLARRETRAGLRFLVSKSFTKRDMQGTWQAELAQLAEETGAASEVYGDAAEAFFAPPR